MAEGNGSNGTSAPIVRVAQAMRRFLELESAGGIILVAVMLVALALVNSPLAPLYAVALKTHAVVGIGEMVIDMPLHHWINDGLMAVFFLLVSLEIKREAMEGELSSPGQVMLPAVAAVGGMAVPAAIFIAFNAGHPDTIRGWAIPSATDIAFSLGVLSVLGRAVPVSLRVFLAALAIIDDLGAIVIIALFYAGNLSFVLLGMAAAATGALWVLNRAGVSAILPYVVVGLVLWACLLGSGVHATLGGVVVGMFIPLRVADGGARAPLRRLEHGLHPWVAFAILPVFALANSGVPLAGIGPGVLGDRLYLGIAVGLFVGKQVGVFATSWLLIRAGLARLPEGAGWVQLYGVAILTGIGFTMSLFIGGLAFGTGTDMVETRFAVLTGSVASALAGYAVLKVEAWRHPHGAGRRRYTAAEKGGWS